MSPIGRKSSAAGVPARAAFGLVLALIFAALLAGCGGAHSNSASRRNPAAAATQPAHRAVTARNKAARTKQPRSVAALLAELHGPGRGPSVTRTSSRSGSSTRAARRASSALRRLLGVLGHHSGRKQHTGKRPESLLLPLGSASPTTKPRADAGNSIGSIIPGG